ncbi:uncharacterized protein LOC121390451 [Gigantopelta aegis]|uniref:uncharacterized protein LOC121390451 n=1 Tax=Gigantopelta aegis TaxID=1735272 RepID=UPI001B88E1A2|nr:uncharacterized protein LOC121390451 [Gigantopelta aegis]
MSQSTSNPETFPEAAVAGGIGGVVLVAVVVIVVVVLVKRKRRKKNQESNDDGDYVNVNANDYTNQNTESFGRHPGVLTDQNQTGNQTIRSPSDDYVSIDDEAGGTTWKPHVALKPNLPSTSMHVNLQPEPDEDDVSNMYAKVNKKKKPIKSVKGPDLPVMHDNELYSVVDKTKKTKLSLKPKPSCDVYAVVNKQKKYRGKSPESIGKGSESEITGDVYTEVRKPKKSGGKSPESKGHGPESEVTGDVYTEVRKPKKSGNKPNIPYVSPGLVYTEDPEQEQGATGGYDDKTDSVGDDVLYSTIC